MGNTVIPYVWITHHTILNASDREKMHGTDVLVDYGVVT